MIIDLLGIIEDGSLRAPTIPIIAGHELRFAAGEDVTVRLTVVKPTGEPGDVTSTYTLTIKKRSLDDFALVTAVGVAQPLDGPGRLNFTISSTLTKDTEPGRYVYDVWRNDGSTKMQIVAPLLVVIRPRCLLP